jgi:hypothetical protein
MSWYKIELPIDIVGPTGEFVHQAKVAGIDGYKMTDEKNETNTFFISPEVFDRHELFLRRFDPEPCEEPDKTVVERWSP